MRKASELLKQTREEGKITLAEVERETKIKKIYLEEIEQGQFDMLPSESYALGFVKNYAKFLGLPLAEIVPLFRREYASKHHVSIIPEFRKKQNSFKRKNFFSGKSILLIAVGLIIIGYVLFQYSSLIFAPSVTILSPKNNSTIASNVVEVRGKTDPYATVSVNGEEVYVDLSGEFKKSVYEFSGNNKIKIVAKNKFGKESVKVISVNVE